MKSLTILGATGSIGSKALSIVDAFPEHFSVTALTAHTNVELLARQIAVFNPRLAAVADVVHAERLKALLPKKNRVKIVCGEEGFVQAATLEETDIVLGAMVGAAGLVPTLAAIDAGKDIALANKETLVMAGPIVMDRVKKRGVKLMPVDSEHSAIFQCLEGHSHNRVQEILLTASGGPFRESPAECFLGITPKDALDHPNWSMGSKITIDSATLMNKGLEVIEAKWLFDVAFQQIKVLVHPQSIVHSMVSYRDGAVIAQMGVPDMKGAIAYGLSHPDRLPLEVPAPDFFQIGKLTFEEPDLKRFPCLGMAFVAGEKGGTHPAVLNAANEVAVAAFLENNLSFVAIPEVIETVLDLHQATEGITLEQILEADGWARETALQQIRKQER
jgi:1-deoxy-D-xylulose-5-phosphate reductoisomerase